MTPRFTYAIHFVADMDRAVKFYRDTLGLALKFASPHWSEFSTGETTVALHPSSDRNPAGMTRLGFNVDDIHVFHKEMTAKGVQFTMAPAKQEFGGMLAEFVDAEGTRVTVSGK
jgi:predicted enzyme related to lactoylglutathione lyase